ncbi:hypothetical protein SLEP1_g18483 [Rubroshorea leprosula]|uniref:CCHC-type domain-containing protein n=1 Tax=Rubroshorea leprosula TaxID=152421 RepID=A0AAV5J156_9ROSI|nr:hypothetical protein SLEP1_g18483 [Rubroshorea leprosula]
MSVSKREAAAAPSTEEVDDLERSIAKTKISGSDAQVNGGENPPHFPSGVSWFKDSLFWNDDWTWSESWFPTEEEPEADEKPDLEEDITSHESEDGTPEIRFSRRYAKKLQEPWKNCLILKIQGKTVHYDVMHARVIEAWNLVGNFKLLDVGCGFYVAKFVLKEDCFRVLKGVPWKILDHYLMVHRWEPTFIAPNQSEFGMTSVWVRLPRLPEEFYEEKQLLRIAEKIGKPLCIDDSSISISRGEYARLCVEVDVYEPLVSEVQVDHHSLSVQYERLDEICIECGKFGHTSENCSVGLVTWKPPPVGVLKLNIDGSVLPSSTSKWAELKSAGGLIRDHLGKWVTGFVVNFGLTGAINGGVDVAILQGLQEGLRLAHSLGIEHLQIELDSPRMVEDVNEGVDDRDPSGDLVRECQRLLKDNWSVSHVLKRTNSCADFLANLGHSSAEGTSVLKEPPEGILQYIS